MKALKIILAILLLILAGELVYIGVTFLPGLIPGASEPSEPPQTLQTTAPTGTTAVTEEPTTLPPTTAATEPSTEPTEAETEPVTEPSTETATEPGPETFTLTFLGDCTIGSAPKQMNVMYSILWYIGEDYSYPFKNVMDYIENDDLTVINLESTLYEGGASSGALFTFRAPTRYVNVITQNSIEAVSFANNHTMDYLQAGYDSTLETLKEANVPYVEKDGSMLLTTESGLTVGFYALAFSQDKKDMEAEIKDLRNKGAEIVIVSAHWGEEGSYRASGTQTEMAYAAIDAGADIVYGHHPHVLQKIEEYNGGIIYYSLGNFVFGGNHWPQDLDSAILQQEVIRDTDGTVSLGELTIIPVSCSSLPVQNNFQPTPYEEGSDKYERVLSKLDGSYKGGNLIVDYNK
ncbi:MAG: CapA family protein [Oscillospiraceae bacterium]|nr:CapA family protein [Oscillospiraceae bacterium]